MELKLDLSVQLKVGYWGRWKVGSRAAVMVAYSVKSKVFYWAEKKDVAMAGKWGRKLVAQKVGPSAE